jgi:hypothetical protein
MNYENKLERPQMKGGCMRDETGNPPGTIYFLNSPIEYIKEKMFGKKTIQQTLEDDINNAVVKFIVDKFPEPVLECDDLEKKMFYAMCEMFAVSPKFISRLFKEYWLSHTFAEIIILGKFKFTRSSCFCAYVYDPTEPKLQELILKIDNVDNEFQIVYTHGVWDKQFIKLITEFSENKRIEKENRERIKEERVHKMFEEEGEE